MRAPRACADDQVYVAMLRGRLIHSLMSWWMYLVSVISSAVVASLVAPSVGALKAVIWWKWASLEDPTGLR